ncbi:MAG TPA: hypothetical protein VFE54_12460, partial [Mucilaginibacter sp.]|nr:hypothetical protein [Mucilaginibacter sp.]
MPARKKLLRYAVSLAIVFFIGQAIDLACGPEPDPYDYYVSFFHNNTQKNDKYQPFYFNGYTFLNGYTDVYIDSERKNEREINVEEWVRYIGPGVKTIDVDQIFYGLDEKADSIYFRTYTDSKRLPDSLKKNSFIKALANKKNAREYFKQIKQTEPYVTGSSKEWNVPAKNESAYHTVALAYLKQGINQRDKFLKLRYFYQAQRLFRYGGYCLEASSVYNKYIKYFPSHSHVKGWALSLEAGGEQYCGHKEKAAYLFSQVFA